jgi:hypothetical protein
MSKKALESGGIFLRLVNDGDKTVVALCGAPYAHEVHWTGTAYEDCNGHVCVHCAAGLRKTLRVGFNVYDVADSRMKIIEGEAKCFRAIAKVRSNHLAAHSSFLPLPLDTKALTRHPYLDMRHSAFVHFRSGQSKWSGGRQDDNIITHVQSNETPKPHQPNAIPLVAKIGAFENFCRRLPSHPLPSKRVTRRDQGITTP